MNLKLLTPALLLLIFLLGSSKLSAHNFVVWLTNGQCVYYSVDQKPKVIAENNMLVLQTTLERVEYSLGDVHKYTIESRSNDIDEVVLKPEFSHTPGCITLSGLDTNAVVTVYDVNGRIVKTLTADGSGTAVVSTVDFASGIYILRTGNTSIKIAKK